MHAASPMAMQQTQETQVRPLGQEDPLQKEMATHSSVLAWRIPMDRGATRLSDSFPFQRLVTKAWRGKPRAHGRDRGGTSPWCLTTTLEHSFLLLFEVNLCCFLFAKFPLLFQSESEVAQLSPALCDPMDCSL